MAVRLAAQYRAVEEGLLVDPNIADGRAHELLDVGPRDPRLRYSLATRRPAAPEQMAYELSNFKKECRQL